MDWKKTFNQGQWAIHGIFLISVVIGIGSTLYALRLNTLQSTEEERILKINSLINYLRTDNSFEKISKYLSWAESDKAQDKMKELSRRMAETEELLEMKASKDIGLGLRTFNKLISSNSGMSNPADALKVLKQKVDSLLSLAQSRKYQTVAATAQRMQERLEQLNAKNAGGSILVSYLRADLTHLIQLVDNSKLDNNEKSSLRSRFESMNDEMDLLSNLNTQARDLKVHVNQATIAVAEWLLDAEKKAANLQGMRQEKQNQLILMLAGLVGFLVLSWMGLAYLFRWQKLKMSEQLEVEVRGVIEKGLMGDERFIFDEYSEKTRKDIVRLMDELKVKLNLGSLLHEGLPFAGCMIDNNFRLSWHNQLFLEQLYLSDEEVRSDAFNWDYVRDYLNLKEDPIYQAMVNKISGIYPVKVKQDELAPAQPYEMYVTPVSANREDRVMVFLYPLVSMNEAIGEQVELTRQCVHSFITLWDQEKLNEDELRLFEKDFKSNDLKDLYEILVRMYQRVNGEKDECLRTITVLEKENDAFNTTLKQVYELEEEKRMVLKEEVKIAADLRNSFIHSLEKSETLLQINRTILQQSDDFKNEAQRMHQMSQQNLKKNRETLEILTHLESVKVDYKKLKFELIEVKAKLISLNNSLFGQLPPLDENQQKLAMRYKDELARLDFNVCTLDKKLSQLDILLGKLQMMNERNPIEQIAFNFQTSQKDHELREAIIEIQKTLNQEEGKIIDHFKNLHVLMRKDMKNISQAQDLSRSSEDLLS